ncbi:MAG: hypothetical protein AAFV33_21230 [Chloroflexota bacterium]
MKNPFRSNTMINVHFRQGGGVQTFQPGDLLEADIEIIPEKVLDCKAVEVAVGWHTEGRGDRNSSTIYVEPIPITQITPENPVNEFFSCRLPTQPWSYTGELIQIVWTVRVKVDFNMLDINHAETFILRP